MADEKDEAYEGHEEGEYHFSDEHANYEMDTESPKVDTTTKTASAALTGFNKYRRPVIIGIVVIVALLAVYKMLMPGYTPQPTDFTQGAPSSAPAKPTQLVTQTPTVAPATQIIPPANQVQQTQQAMQNQQPTQAPPLTQGPGMQGQMGQAGQTQAGAPTQPGTVTDRVAAVEDQNAKLANMLQIEYAQKMADQAAQEAATQAKLQELSGRVANMETIITQLSQLLQNKVSNAAPAVSQQSRTFAQHISYVVQAIIPGRAWLKSDNGDTITVAEGDRLRGYGRVTKIDPYDGVVTIDAGNKILTLSYGMSSDS